MLDGSQVIGSGTGFFYQDRLLTYITNRHVIIDEDSDYYPDKLLLKIHTGNNINELPVNEFEKIPLYNVDGTKRWYEHPTLGSSADVVCIIIPPTSIINKCSLVRYITPKNGYPSNVQTSSADQVSIIGYPKGYYDEFHNLPIVKTGHIASPFGYYHNEKSYFLVDATVEEGMSGSPVFTQRILSFRDTDGKSMLSTKPDRYFLGIFSASIVKNEQELSLHLVWYASIIHQILESIPDTNP